MRTSSRGRTRSHNGYVMLDGLFAVAILLVGISAATATVRGVTRTVVRASTALEEFVEAQNEWARGVIEFDGEE